MKTRYLAATATLVLLGSCSAPYSGVTIYQICAFPTPDTTTGDCLYEATCADTLVGPPVLDVAGAAYDFVLPIQFDNQLVSSANTANGTVNANDAYVENVNVTYAGAALNPVNVPVTLTVPATGSITGVIPLIPAAYFSSLPVSGTSLTEVVLTIKASGKFLSQQTFTTQTFQIPVLLCSGCLATAANACPSGKTLSGVCPQFGQTNTVSCQ
ncbi:MAG TPA: hypothetical protein VMT17_16980 [Anaeromyxobacteraceae bacterium]|nr:hypothetical protein [Anaeromyxobacteraceae bacterium]